MSQKKLLRIPLQYLDSFTEDRFVDKDIFSLSLHLSYQGMMILFLIVNFMSNSIFYFIQEESYTMFYIITDIIKLKELDLEIVVSPGHWYHKKSFTGNIL